jgi:hypothetical protein
MTLREKVWELIMEKVGVVTLGEVRDAILALIAEDRRELEDALKALYVCSGPISDECGEEWKLAHEKAHAALGKVEGVT